MELEHNPLDVSVADTVMSYQSCSQASVQYFSNNNSEILETNGSSLLTWFRKLLGLIEHSIDVQLQTKIAEPRACDSSSTVRELCRACDVCRPTMDWRVQELGLSTETALLRALSLYATRLINSVHSFASIGR